MSPAEEKQSLTLADIIPLEDTDESRKAYSEYQARMADIMNSETEDEDG